MMKFFRKHMKKMLMVFMVALLIVWLGGTALDNMLRTDSSRADELRGTIFGREVRQREIDYTNYHAETLNVIYPNWRLMLSPPGAEPLSDVEFFLLVNEAIEDGVYISRPHIDKFMQMVPAPQLDFVRKHYKRSLDRVREAVRAYLMVIENMSQAQIAAQPSEADIASVIRQTTEEVEISAVVVPARDFINETYQPSDDDLSEQFEKYKNEPKSYGFLEFGYQLPEAVQVEYIQVNVEQLTEQETVTDQQAYDYWKDHQNEFIEPPPQTQPSTNPADQPKRKPYGTYTEAKADVIKKLRDQKGKDAALAVARELIGLLAIPWAAIPTTQPDGYKEPPPGEKADDVYQKLIDRQQSKYAGILKYGRTGLVTRNEAMRAEEIGPSSALSGTPLRTAFNQVAFMVPGTSASREDDKQRVRFFRSIWETCQEPLTDFKGNAYVFRTIAARPAQPPDSFEDVREDLVRDLRNLEAYRAAERSARALFENTKDKDLEAAFNATPELIGRLGRSALRDLPPFPRAELAPYSPNGLGPARVPGMQGDEAFIDLCFASPEAKPYIRIHEQKRFGQWVVLERQGILPVYRTDFEEQRDRARGLLMRKDLTAFRQEWLSADSIRKRTAWQAVEETRREAEEGETPSAGAEATS